MIPFVGCAANHAMAAAAANETSLLPTATPRGIERVCEIGIAVHGEPARHAISSEAGQMVPLPVHIDDVALIGHERLKPFDGVADLTEQDEPELGTFFMVVALVQRVGWGDATAENHV